MLFFKVYSMKHSGSCLIHLFGCLFLTLFMFSCEYELEGENFKKIDPVPPSGLNLMLEKEGDTLNIRGAAVLKFSTTRNDREIRSYDLFIGDVRVSGGTGFPYEIKFDSESYENAYHTLSLVAHYRSYTNSLADKLDAERYTKEYNWKIRIDNTKVSSYKFDQIKIYKDGGKLRIDWPKYDQLGFGAYGISKEVTTNGSHEHKHITFKDINITSWIDESYIGKPTTYTFYLGDAVSGSASRKFSIAEEQPAKLLPIVDANGAKVEVSWNSCKYFENFSSYKLIFGPPHPHTSVVEFSKSSDTTFLAPPLVFGQHNIFHLETVSKNLDGMKNNLVSEQKIYLGTEVPFSAYRALYVPGNHSYYTIDSKNTTLKRYSAETHQEVASMTAPEHIANFAVSADGSSMYYLQWEVLIKCNPENLQTLERIPISDLIGFKAYPDQLAAYQDLVSFNIKYDSTNPFDSVILADIKTKSVLGKDHHRSRIQSIVFSPNGESTVVTDKSWSYIYLTKNRGLKRINSFSGGWDYMHDGSGRILHYQAIYKELYIIQPTGTFYREHAMPISSPLLYLHVDPRTNKIGSVQPSTDNKPHQFEIYTLSGNYELQKHASIPVSTTNVKMTSSELTSIYNNYILPLDK